MSSESIKDAIGQACPESQQMMDSSPTDCFAQQQQCICDRCHEEVPLLDMAQWEFKGWDAGISWCRKCFQLRQFKTERNTGPRVPEKKKMTHVNTCIQKISTLTPVSWSECMDCIDAEFPDPKETCKFLQSDAKRVPKQTGSSSFELVRFVWICVPICNADANVLREKQLPPSLGPPPGAISVGPLPRTGQDVACGRAGSGRTAFSQTRHVFATDLQEICMGEPVPPTAVAVMRTSDGRNNCSKKQPYLAFLLPERGRYVWMRSWEAWGLRKCSLCEYPRTYRFFRLNTINYYGNDACARFKSQCDCCEPLYMRLHIKEKKHQDEIKRLVQSPEIDTMFRGKRHDVHFDMEKNEEEYMKGVASGEIKPGLGPFGMYQKPKVTSDSQVVPGRRTRPSKADDSGLKLCQFCDQRKKLSRFPVRLIMTSKGHAERKLGAHCKKCMIRSAHLRSNGYMRPQAQDLLKAYHSNKKKSSKFTGANSDSEDYEVDDNSMVEKQMRELGVNVIMHPTMIEDLAIVKAAQASPQHPEHRASLRQHKASLTADAVRGAENIIKSLENSQVPHQAPSVSPQIPTDVAGSHHHSSHLHRVKRTASDTEDEWEGGVHLAAIGQALVTVGEKVKLARIGHFCTLNVRGRCCGSWGAVLQVDKVTYLRGLEAIPNHHVRRAELLLLQGKSIAAEEILVSNRLVWAAVDLNVRLFNWERALGIAEQSDNPSHVQGVLWLRACRAHHLRMLNKDPLKRGKHDECLDKFARLFHEQGVPVEKSIRAFIEEQSVAEGMTS